MGRREPALNRGSGASRRGPGPYRRVADLFHELLAEHSLAVLLERVGDALSELVPYDSLTIYKVDQESDRLLVPVLVRDEWAEEILKDSAELGKGISGWAAENREAVLANDALRDPRVAMVPGTPVEPEALIAVPLIARDSLKGVLNIYRIGDGASFTQEEFELAQMFGDAAALALDNAEVRAALEQRAMTDPLTGLYNHRYFHERLRSELTRAARVRDSVTVLMVDLDDFNRVNDVHGHGCGDRVLVVLSEILASLIRGSDVACRLGGEEFAVIMPSCDAGDALGLATRLTERVAQTDFDPAGKITLSIGIAQGPDHGAGSRELAGCAEAALLTAKQRGKDRIVLYDDEAADPGAARGRRDVRSIAHLKMLQSLAGKLNRLNEVRQIGNTISNELRTLIDYHSCLVYVRDADLLIPVAARGELAEIVENEPEKVTRRIGQGIVGHVARTGRPLLVADALNCDLAVQVPGTPEVEESILAVPLTYGSTVIGAIVISSLGTDRFDEDDQRLMEVLAGHASVALENARLFESERREADNAKALLELADALSRASGDRDVGCETAKFAARILGAEQAALWMMDDRTGDFVVDSHVGYAGDPEVEGILRMRIDGERGRRFLAEHDGPVVLTPLENEACFGELPEEVAVRTTAVAPLQGVAGWLCVRQPSRGGVYFTRERLRLLAGVSHQASIAIQKIALYRVQKETADIANSLLEFGRDLASAEDIDQVLKRVVERTARILGSPATAVCLPDGETDELIVREMWGYEGRERDALLGVRLERDLTGFLQERDRPFVVDGKELETAGAGAVVQDVSDELSYAIAPLHLDGSAGCIVASAPVLGDYHFSERKMRLLGGIAHQARMAILNASRFDDLEKTFLSTVEALANALEAKDEYTSSHARWITDVALEVADRLGLDPETRKRLELGALFHDIGKIGIPSEILLKPGPLSDEEWAIIKLHPEMGERILAPIDRLAEVRRIVRHCHEHFDGSGYPDGIRGEDIPIEARVILVVDAYHAMTTDRSYRKALGTQQACRRLVDAAGTQFDPRVVDAFLQTLSQRAKSISA